MKDPRHQPCTRLPAIAGLLAVVVATGVLAGDGVYTQTGHGDTAKGPFRLTSEPRGDCAQCHDQHASRDAVPTGGPHPFLLFRPNDNQLCASAGCHTGPGPLGIFEGLTAYGTSLHAKSTATVWPGTPGVRARPAGDAGLCLNCHTAHGRADGTGTIPSLVAVREEGSCLTCHDSSGPAAVDIASEFTKPFRHPTGQFQGRHQPGELLPTAFENANRHAECEDCHNPHEVQADTVAPVAPNASKRIQGVSRVSVSNGPAGSVPVYTFRPADDPAPVLEYETCFKCHSSWVTSIRAGSADLALLFNKNNPSYHPVEGPGQNPGIATGAFVNGWKPSDQMYCGDCHGSDDPSIAGPHGSMNDGLLRSRYTASPAFRTMNTDELCFSCHSYDTYADESSSNTVQGYSRWNRPEESKGHAWHQTDEQVTCFSCHDTHGSTSNPHLLVFGRNPGLMNWVDDGGGQRTCSPTCHGPESYDVNY